MIFVQQGDMQRVKPRLFARLARLENTAQRLAQAIQHLVFNVLKEPLATQDRRLATSVQQAVTQQQARQHATSAVLVNTHHHSLLSVGVVMLGTTRKNRRRVAICVRREPSVTQRHLLGAYSAHQDTTLLLVQRVALPVRD